MQDLLTMAYTSSVTDVIYYVNDDGDPPFIPGNCQAPTNSHDNPDNGTLAQRKTQCLVMSPLATVTTVT